MAFHLNLDRFAHQVRVSFSLIPLFSLLLGQSALSQDTLKVMHYNLLNYGNITSYCNSSNNSITAKNAALRKIIAYASPDVFTVNEISDLGAYHEMLLDSVFDVVFPGRYTRAGFSNGNGSSIVNDLYYDLYRVLLTNVNGIYCDIRDADAYQLAVLPSIPGADTASLLCVVTYLKAGSDVSDEQDRAGMVSDILNWLSNTGRTGNNLLLGDLNLKSSYEPAWYNLTQFPDMSVRFYDPVNALGEWYNNDLFRELHSQSTHSYSNNCAAGGGLDDRFDFILAGRSLLEGTLGLQYASGSYTVLGQDGNRLNGSVHDPVNTAVPQDVAEALYAMSDHLPVMVGLRHGAGTGWEEPLYGRMWVEAGMPGSLCIRSNIPFTPTFVSCHTADGRCVWSGDLVPGETAFTVPRQLAPAFYVLRLNSAGRQMALKAVVQ